MTTPSRIVLSIVGVAIAASVLSIALLFVSGGIDIPHCGMSDENCIQQQKPLIDRALFLATIIGIALSAIGTFALVVTIFLSARATEAAVTAADAARLAVDQARKTSSRELRPYMAFGEQDQTPYQDVNKNVTHWSVRVRWLNTGHTAAVEVKSRTNYVILLDDLPTHFGFPDNNFTPWAGAIGRERYFYCTSGYIPTADIQRIIDGQMRLFAWSWVEYQGMEPGDIYRSEWCGEVWLYNGPATSPGVTSSNRYQGRFNGVDERCYRKPGALAPTA